MKYMNLSLREAFQFVQSKRKIIRPNNGFFQQLIEYERSLYGRTTVEMMQVKDTAFIVPDVFYEVCKDVILH